MDRLSQIKLLLPKSLKINYLSTRNISAERLNAVGFGENNPIDTNINSAGRANNRRVEILFVK